MYGKDSWKKGLALLGLAAVVGISSFYTFTLPATWLGVIAGLGNLAWGGWNIYKLYKQWENI